MTTIFEIEEEMPLLLELSEADVSSIADRVLEEALDELGCPYETQVSVLITGPEQIRKLNRDFRGIDRETDVLSFPSVPFSEEGEFAFLEDSAYDDCFDPETGELVLGDIVINQERVISQAEEYGHSQVREYAFLLTHSILHLCGYDHMETEEEARMIQKQKEILAALSIDR